MTEAELAALDEQILEAHARQDIDLLHTLYHRASRHHASLGADQAAGFFLTQAYVFALDSGNPDAESIACELRRTHRL